MLTVTLTKDTTVVTLPAPQPGGTETRARRQASAASADGTRYVYDAGALPVRREERFESLTSAEAGALADFFDLVGGMQAAFTYTDSKGTAQAVRFAESALTFTRHGPECVDVEVAFLVGEAA